MKQTRVVYLNSGSGVIDFRVQAGVYRVTLEAFSFSQISNSEFMTLRIDSLELGYNEHPVLVNHSGYSIINAHYNEGWLNPYSEYKLTDMSGATVDFSTNNQELTLVFQMERLDEK